MATHVQTVKAIQKNTSEIVARERVCSWVAVAAEAAEYIPSGKTAAHHTPWYRNEPGTWSARHAVA